MGHKVKQSLTSSRIDFFYYAFSNVLLVSIPLLIVSSVVLSHLSLHSSATGSSSGVDQIQFSLSVSCTLSSVVDSAHTKEITNGTYHSDVGKTTITTLCNDGNGYSVYAAGYSNNENGNTKLINAEHPEYSIDTGLATSGLISNWAMKLNNIPDDPSPTPPVIEPAYDNTYGLVPQYWTRVASRPSGTTDMDEGSSFTTTYAIYTTSNQHAGTYNGQVKYMLVHPNNNKPTLYNLELAFASHGIQPIYRDEDNKYYFAMQDMTHDICKAVDIEESELQLIDLRDNKVYWVAKLKDGNCWMTQNLDLDIDNTKTYTHDDTDLGWNPNSFDANATWKPDTTNGRYNLPVNGTSVPGWPNQNNYPYSADPGDVYYYTSNSTSDDIKYTSLSACITAGHTEGDCKHYHAGDYYNWTAAIASNNSSSLTTQYTNASNSICPAGWRLPIATNADQSIYEFGEMLYRQGITVQKIGNPVNYATNGFNNIRKTPLWFVRAGMIANGAVQNGTIISLYSSSTVFDYDSDYILNINKDSVRPSIYFDGWYSKYGGKSVRCLAR